MQFVPGHTVNEAKERPEPASNPVCNRILQAFLLPRTLYMVVCSEEGRESSLRIGHAITPYMLRVLAPPFSLVYIWHMHCIYVWMHGGALLYDFLPTMHWEPMKIPWHSTGV